MEMMLQDAEAWNDEWNGFRRVV